MTEEKLNILKSNRDALVNSFNIRKSSVEKTMDDKINEKEFEEIQEVYFNNRIKRITPNKNRNKLEKSNNVNNLDDLKNIKSNQLKGPPVISQNNINNTDLVYNSNEHNKIKFNLLKDRINVFQKK